MRFLTLPVNVDLSKVKDRKEDDFQPTLDCYLLKPASFAYKRKAVIICPGGGYHNTTEREAEPVAMKFLQAGVQAFVLWYSVSPDRYPVSLMEAAEAVKMVRDRAEEFEIDPDSIAIMGFSAGGHLAASLSTMWQEEWLNHLLGTKKEEIRPNASILCYPVITSGEKGHRRSFTELLGSHYEELLEETSLEKRVNSMTPPTFIWSTWTDQSVPIENTLLYVEALRKAGVNTEVHIFKKGLHGLSIASRDTQKRPEIDPDGSNSILPYVRPWVQLCLDWFETLSY